MPSKTDGTEPEPPVEAIPPEQGGEEEPAAFRQFAAWAMRRFDDPELLTWRDVDAWDRATGAGLINRDPAKAMETHIKMQADRAVSRLRMTWGKVHKTIRAFYSIRPETGVDVPGLGYMPAPWVLQNIHAREQKLEQYGRMAEGLAAGMRALRATPAEWKRMEDRMREAWAAEAPESEVA